MHDEARSPADPALRRDEQVEILEREVVYQGFFRIVRYRLRHRQFAGGMSPVLTREVFERGNAVAVLPYDPERDRVLMVEQFRAGALDAPGEPWLLEPVAGIVEEGETPEDVVRREADEEAGLEILDLVPVCEYFVSPGGAAERCRVFVGRIDAGGAGGLFGRADEAEDIKVHVLSFDDAMAHLSSDRPLASHAVISLQWLLLNRGALRRRWLGADAAGA